MNVNETTSGSCPNSNRGRRNSTRRPDVGRGRQLAPRARRLFGDPVPPRARLRSIAARRVLAPYGVTAEHCRAAVLDCAHHLQPWRAYDCRRGVSEDVAGRSAPMMPSSMKPTFAVGATPPSPCLPSRLEHFNEKAEWSCCGEQMPKAVCSTFTDISRERAPRST